MTVLRRGLMAIAAAAAAVVALAGCDSRSGAAPTEKDAVRSQGPPRPQPRVVLVPVMAQVPDVSGLYLDGRRGLLAVERRLCEADLRIGAYREVIVPSARRPRVLGTRPPAGSVVPLGTRVVVRVAASHGTVFAALPGSCR